MSRVEEIEANGMRFTVRVGGGDGGDTVLLLHGFPQHGGMWDRVAERLHAAGLRTIAPDQRGYSPGARPDDPAAYRMPAIAADAAALLDAYGVESAHVVGHDWGALAGWHLTARHPSRVRTLTAVSVPHPRAFASALRDDPDQKTRSGYMGLFAIEGKAEEVLLRDGAATLRAIFGPVDRDAVESYVRPMLEPDALTGALQYYRANHRDDLDGAGPIAHPTTYVWGDQDIAIGRVAAERCAEHVTGPYEFVPLAGVSHWVPDERPGEVAGAALTRILG